MEENKEFEAVSAQAEETPAARTTYLQDVIVEEGALPEFIYVNGNPFHKGDRVEVDRTVSVSFEDGRRVSDPVEMTCPEDGIIRIKRINWKLRVRKDDFIVTDRAGNPVGGYTVSINSRFLSRSLTLSRMEAESAEVSIEAKGYNIFRERRNLLNASGYEIRLSKEHMSGRFIIDDVTNEMFYPHASFEIECEDFSRLDKSPIVGYRLKTDSRDGEKHLRYDNFAFFHRFSGICSLLVALLLGFAGGMFAHKYLFTPLQSDPETPEAALTAEPQKDTLAAAVPEEPVAEQPQEVSEEEKQEPAEEKAEAVKEESPLASVAVPVVNPDVVAAVKYLEDTAVWNSVDMEKIAPLAGLWDAVNTYNAAEVERINANLHSARLDRIVAALKAHPRKGKYADWIDKDKGIRDTMITYQNYIKRVEAK